MVAAGALETRVMIVSWGVATNPLSAGKVAGILHVLANDRPMSDAEGILWLRRLDRDPEVSALNRLMKEAGALRATREMLRLQGRISR